MNAYTVSRLADDAGVSVHVVRDYIVRGLLRPVACTTGGCSTPQPCNACASCGPPLTRASAWTRWRGCVGRWMLRTATVRLRSLPCYVSS